MIHDHKTYRPCPCCNHPLPRKGFHALLGKCEACHKLTCGNCRFGHFCLDCYSLVHEREEVLAYFAGRVVA